MNSITKQRFDFFTYVYKSLLLNISNEDIKINSFEKEDFSSEWLQVIENLSDNYDGYIKKIEENLKSGWTIGRLSIIDRSLLVCALAESATRTIDRKIIINEYVNLTKKYGSQDASYRLVNGLLEKLI